ncbi:MAG: hypothetical protein ACKVOM_03455 [Ferruginibacter sp.]
MSNDTDNILQQHQPGSNKGLQELSDALNREEDLDEHHDHFFEEDAKEGLQQIDQEKIPDIISQLNANLKAQLKTKKRNKKKIPDQTMLMVTIVTILILAIVAFIVIKRFLA